MRYRLLLISYDFPPIGGGGVQRNVKFLKYLNRLGWKTEVLTVKERDYYVFDESLLNEVKDTVIHRSESYDPLRVAFRLKRYLEKFRNRSGKTAENKAAIINEGAFYVKIYRNLRNWLLLPDGYNLWIPFANNLGKKIIQNNKPDILFCTFPSPSNAFITYKLAKKFKIPYVIDFRDGWTDDPYTKYASFLHKKYHEIAEKRIIKKASKIIVYADALKKNFVAKYPNLKDNIEVIRNGFDPEDFIDLPFKIKKEKIQLIYSGSVYFDRKNTYINFINALKLLEESLREKLEVIFVGDKLDWAIELVNSSNLNNVISFTGYVPHKEALRYLSNADGFLLFLAKGDKIALTGKIFEYIALHSPIIACVESDGACSTLLKSINHDKGVCDPDDPKDIMEKIKLLVTSQLPNLDNNTKKLFSRKEQASKLDTILKSVVG